MASFIQMLDSEVEAAKLYADNRKLAGTDNYNYVNQRVHSRLWLYVKRIGVMPLHIQQTHEDLFRLYMDSRGRGTCKCNVVNPEPDPCSCETKVLFQQGCQCGGC